MEKLLDCKVLFVLILGSMKVDRREIKLLSHSLLVLLTFVAELHVFENRACDTNHEFWHFEDLFTRIYRRDKSLPIDLLSNSIKMSEYDATL